MFKVRTLHLNEKELKVWEAAKRSAQAEGVGIKELIIKLLKKWTEGK